MNMNYSDDYVWALIKIDEETDEETVIRDNLTAKQAQFYEKRYEKEIKNMKYEIVGVIK